MITNWVAKLIGKLVKKICEVPLKLFFKPFMLALEDSMAGVGHFGDHKQIARVYDERIQVAADKQLALRVIHLEQYSKDLEGKVMGLEKVVDKQTKLLYKLAHDHADTLQNLNAQMKMLRSQVRHGGVPLRESSVTTEEASIFDMEDDMETIKYD